MESILDSIKVLLGSNKEDTHFDPEIAIHINSAIMTLTQLGVGPVEGFSIQDKIKTWSDFLGDRTDLEAIKSYIYLKVRLVFDTPTSSFVIAAYEKQIAEFEWRLNVQQEGVVIDA